MNRAILILFLVLGAGTSHAQPSIINGGFESGFTGWTRADQLGSLGTYALQTGTLSPVNGMTVPAPPGGLTAAMTDAQGPGSHVLYQDVTIPTGAVLQAQLRMDLFIGNRATAFTTPSTLDFSTPALNQQMRVDLMPTTADPFSLATPDVLQNAFRTNVGNPLVSGYTTITVDITSVYNANAGGTLRFRFAEVDNVFLFQSGVDNVALIVTPVPEPGLLGVLGLTAGLQLLRRRFCSLENST